MDRALELSESSDEKKSITLNLLAEIKYKSGDYGIGRMQARQAQRLAKLAANLSEEGNALFSEALCCTALGDYLNSSLLLHKAKELKGLCGMIGASDSFISLEAEVHLLKSEYAEARSIHRQLIDSTPQNNTYGHAFALLNISQIDVMIGAYTDARRNLENATLIFKSTQHHIFLAYCDMIMADLNLKEGHNLVAKEQFQQCLASAWDKDQQVVFFCLERLANVCHWSAGDFDKAFTWAVLYLVQGHKLKQRLDLHKALQFLGNAFVVDGDEGTAHNLFVMALEGFTSMDVHCSRAECMLQLGDLAQKKGDIAGAEGLWREARPLFEHTLQTGDVEKIDIRLNAIQYF